MPFPTLDAAWEHFKGAVDLQRELTDDPSTEQFLQQVFRAGAAGAMSVVNDRLAGVTTFPTAMKRLLQVNEEIRRAFQGH
jgi:hypothetical protein